MTTWCIAAPQAVLLQNGDSHVGGQSGGEGNAAAAAEDEEPKEGPPYTLKCANQMGDVRLSSETPPSPEQSVLYFTAQWERDGGGVYDVSKLVQPEAS